MTTLEYNQLTRTEQRECQAERDLHSEWLAEALAKVNATEGMTALAMDIYRVAGITHAMQTVRAWAQQ